MYPVPPVSIGSYNALKDSNKETGPFPSNMDRVDEETPLLNTTIKIHPTPLPWKQLSLILFLHISEPLTSQIVTPFIPQLMRDLGVTGGNEAKVGHYVGLMQSLFFVTEAMTVLHWSRLSDYIGRKPVAMLGLLGMSLSMFSFGLSKTFWTLVLSRCLCGALNGNIGVLKSMVGEISDASNIAQAYAYLPITWCIGCAIAPAIGGSLAQPADQFPEWFSQIEFFKTYPYFLPCAVSGTWSACMIGITYLFMKETVKAPSSISEILGIRKKGIKTEDTTPFLEPRLVNQDKKPVAFSKLMTRPVLTAAGNYAAVALLDIAYRGIQPLFYSTPVEFGGLGLSPHTIGIVLSLAGAINGIALVFLFSKLHNRFGTKNVFIAGVAGGLPLFVMYPIINILARAGGMNITVWIAVVVQIFMSVGMNFSISAVSVFITAAAPNRASLGATNGVAQVAVSIMRAVGPTSAASLFSLSIEHSWLGGRLVYLIFFSLVCMAIALASLLPQKIKM